MSKVISFIIPSYNVERYLETALESLLCKTCLSEIEIIVVNDGSQDKTQDIAETYVQRYPNCVRLVNKENGGHGSAINAGSRAATGTFFKVIDADDWVVTENLPAFLSALQGCSSDVVLTPFHQVNLADGKRSAWRMYCDSYQRLYTLEEIINDWKSFDKCLSFHGITYRTAFYEEHRYELPEKIFYEDQEFATIPCCWASSVYPIDLFLYQYQIGNPQQSVSISNRLKRLSHVEQVTRDLLLYKKAHPELPAVGQEYLLRKLEGIMLSHYVATCLLMKNKRLGRMEAARYNQMIQKLDPSVYKRVAKKYRVYCFMSDLHVPFSLYEAILQSRLYSVLRKTHRVRRE